MNKPLAVLFKRDISFIISFLMYYVKIVSSNYYIIFILLFLKGFLRLSRVMYKKGIVKAAIF